MGKANCGRIFFWSYSLLLSGIDFGCPRDGFTGPLVGASAGAGAGEPRTGVEMWRKEW